MINVHPLQGFTHLTTMAKVVRHYHEGNGYHISLCFMSELGPGGRDADKRTHDKHNGKTGTLSVQIANSAAALTPQSPLSVELLQDPDITNLHASGKYADRPLHFSF